MISLLILNNPPGLYRQLMVSGSFPRARLYTFDVRNIIQVDDPADFMGIFEFFFRRIVGRKHDIALSAPPKPSPSSAPSWRSSRIRSHTPAGSESEKDWALLLPQKFFESRIPCKSLFQRFRVTGFPFHHKDGRELDTSP